MSNARKITIVILLLLTIALAGVSVFVAYRLQQEDQAPDDSEASSCTDPFGCWGQWRIFIGGLPDQGTIDQFAECILYANPCDVARGYPAGEDSVCTCPGYYIGDIGCGDLGSLGFGPAKRVVKGQGLGCAQICGDGLKHANELCDDGNQIDNDSCSNSCTPPSAVCGDGTKAATEQCDDGNTTNGDWCSSTCTLTATATGQCVDNQSDVLISWGAAPAGTGNQYYLLLDDDPNNANDAPLWVKTITDMSITSTTSEGFCRYTNASTPVDCNSPITIEEGGTYYWTLITTVNGVEYSAGQFGTLTVDSGTCEGPVCGDGVVDEGEQCDDGNQVNTDACSNTCTTNVTAQCISLSESGPDPIDIGDGNVITYTLRYRNASTTNPYPNIGLIVEGSRGRDFYRPNQTVVAPAQTTGNPSFDAANNIWTYTFAWEAADTTGTVVTPMTDGDYDVTVLLNSSDQSTAINTAACLGNLVVTEGVDQEPVFEIVKTSVAVCQADQSVIDYTITVTNIGPVTGIIDFVEDDYDDRLTTLGIVPTNITPAYYSLSGGIIRWTGSEAERTFTAGQSRTYTYRVTIPEANYPTFQTSGNMYVVGNQALVQYDTVSQTDNTATFDMNTTLTCSGMTIPATSIFGDNRTYLIIAILIFVAAILVYKYQIGSDYVNLFGKRIKFTWNTKVVDEFAPDSFERKVARDIKKRK